ncbi:MAG: hypothetical protein HY260_23685, partial [Chloroflexi bacterium]|nr:hypothetical protein [Chloroflexota bacterium]
GRLYRWWASVAPNAAERIARAQTADGYYTRAVTLSPQNATLWDEWASLDLSFLDDRAGALEKLNHSLGLDAKYDRTYALLGDYHATLARAAGDPAEYAQAAEAYQRGIALTPDAISLRIGLGAVYSATGQNDRAIDSYSQAVKVAPPTVNLTNVFRALAELYRRDGDKGNALKYARLALSHAPDEMKPEIQKFIEELNAGR